MGLDVDVSVDPDPDPDGHVGLAGRGCVIDVVIAEVEGRLRPASFELRRSMLVLELELELGPATADEEGVTGFVGRDDVAAADDDDGAPNEVGFRDFGAAVGALTLLLRE